MKMNHDGNSANAANFIVKTTSDEETLDLGRKLGRLLRPKDIVALVGDLATGKTWLAKGIAFGLGVPGHEYVNSPAFDLIHEYQGRLTVYHMDFYRLDNLSAEDYMWLDEYLYGEGVCIIEWADKFIDKLAKNYLRVELKFVNGENEREIHIIEIGGGYGDIIESLKQQ